MKTADSFIKNLITSNLQQDNFSFKNILRNPLENYYVRKKNFKSLSFVRNFFIYEQQNIIYCWSIFNVWLQHDLSI